MGLFLIPLTHTQINTVLMNLEPKARAWMNHFGSRMFMRQLVHCLQAQFACKVEHEYLCENCDIKSGMMDKNSRELVPTAQSSLRGWKQAHRLQRPCKGLSNETDFICHTTRLKVYIQRRRCYVTRDRFYRWNDRLYDYRVGKIKILCLNNRTRLPLKQSLIRLHNCLWLLWGIWICFCWMYRSPPDTSLSMQKYSITNTWFNVVVPHEQDWKRQTWKYLRSSLI